MPDVLTKRLPNGKQFRYERHNTDPHSSVFTFEDEEEIRQRWFYPFISADDVVVDVGAAYGSYTLPAMALGCMVIAFSPEHDYSALVNNITINQFALDAIVIKGGLYSKRGWLETYTQQYFETPHSGGVNKDKNGVIIHSEVIEVRAFDQLIEEIKQAYPKINKIDYVKMDVEGAELEVLKGMEQSIRKYKPKHMLIENHMFKDVKLQDQTISLIQSWELGYKQKTEAYHGITHSFYWLE